MPANAQQFARRVLDAFVEAGIATDALVGAAGGPSTSTMTKLRKVAVGEDTMPEPREPTWSKIDKAAGWLPGSARRVWHGAEPTPMAEEHGDALDDIVGLLPLFDALPAGTRDTLVEIAEALAHRGPARPNYVVRDREGDELAVEVTQEWSGLSHGSAQLVENTANELLWDHPGLSSVVIQVVSADAVDQAGEPPADNPDDMEPR
jgi:hypothetical protein